MTDEANGFSHPRATAGEGRAPAHMAPAETHAPLDDDREREDATLFPELGSDLAAPTGADPQPRPDDEDDAGEPEGPSTAPLPLADAGGESIVDEGFKAAVVAADVPAPAQAAAAPAPRHASAKPSAAANELAGVPSPAEPTHAADPDPEGTDSTAHIPDFLTDHAAPAPEQAAAGATSPADTADLIEAARAAGTGAVAADSSSAHGSSPAQDHVPGDDPSDTAEIDVEAVEAKLSDPGSTQSFAPITDDQVIDADSTYDTGATAQLMWGARSDVGRVRSHNEDSYLVQSPLFAVCDGMGGHAAGEVASSIAVETIAKTAPKTADAALLGAAVEAANAAVIEAAVNGLGKPGMGCTATVAYVEKDTVAVAHVGDSRAYLLHEGSLIRITRDHSYVEELVDAGEITADEARVHPNRSVITRALGSDPAMYADHFQINVETGDRLILCSDGLSSMIPDGEIERIASQSTTPQICTDNLVDAALAAGGSDNVTVVVVDLVDDGKLKEAARKRRRNLLIAVAALVAVLAIGAAVSLFSITGSIYLGERDGKVAIYSGVPGRFLGLDLHWLQDETSVALDDLPEDTQSRLRDGIPQDGMDAAIETVSKYRKQIYEEQTKQAQNADAVRDGATADAQAQPQGQTAQQAQPQQPANQTTQGGQAQ